MTDEVQKPAVGFSLQRRVGRQAGKGLPMNELKIPSECNDTEELHARFNITCRRCGSSDVVINAEPSYQYSEYTRGGGYVQIGCNACGKNDMNVSS